MIELFEDGAGLRLPGDIRRIYDEATGACLVPDAGPRWPAALTLGRDGVIGVLDTGVISRHPVMRARLVEAVDLTGGRDPEDRHGHGTIAALLATLRAPDARIRSAKVASGPGAPAENLVKGLRWAARLGRERLDAVTLSVGVYRRRCHGHCRVCEAAKAVADDGISLMCAAGTDPGRVACPATLAMVGHPNVFAVRLAPGVLGVTLNYPHRPLRLVNVGLAADADPDAIDPRDINDIDAYLILDAVRTGAISGRARADRWLALIDASGARQAVLGARDRRA